MMHLVHIDPRLDGQIEELRRAGKKGRIAAAHAEEVIAAMKSGGPGEARQLPRTHKGENRLDGCIKYDLGGGYRLLTIKQGKDRFVLFAGSHDDCDRWIENNRELAIDAIRERCSQYRVAHRPGAGWAARLDQAPREPPTPNHQDPEPLLDQKILRLVFAGLCRAD
jgi:hypothetical protein